MSYGGMIVIIPTRNRAELARNALDSVLSQPDYEVQILVSDNSTTCADRAELSRYCQQLASERLRYLTPPEPLPITQHWDWAMQQALSLYDCTHFTFLTDRMMFKPGALKPLIEIITTYPDKILSYMHDKVDDFSTPVVLHQYTWTGNLYEVSSTHLLQLPAQSVMYDSCLPRMLNCIAPRDVLDTIRRRFGSVFASLAPDWNFCYRALDTVDSMLFYDKAALVHYSQHRSAGESTHHGVVNEAFVDFMDNLGAPMNYAAPFPEIVTVWNAIISEYCHVKQVTKSPKFPELNLDTYRQALAAGVDQIKDPQRRAHMRALLSARGWKPLEVASAPASQPPPPVAKVGKPLWPRRLARKLVRETKNSANHLARRFVPPRPSAHADENCLVEKQVPRVEAFSVNAIEFQSSEDALQYALSHPRERAAASDHETLIQGVAVPLPENILSF